MTGSEQQRDNRLEKKKKRTSETWGTLTERPIIRIPERVEKDSGPSNIFQEVQAEYFINLANHKHIVSRNLVKPRQDNLKEMHAKTYHNQTSEEKKHKKEMPTYL